MSIKMQKLADDIKRYTSPHPTKTDLRGFDEHNSWRVDHYDNDVEYHIAEETIYVKNTTPIKFYSDCIRYEGVKYPVSYRSLKKVIDIAKEVA
jgi:hypothetical protein